MNNAVKITDRDQIYDIFITRFKTGKIFLKTAEINIQVESFSFADGEISIVCPGVDEKIKSVIFYIRDNVEAVFSHAVLRKTGEAGVLIYEPLDIQIVQIPRKEERKSVASVEQHESTPIYISNIISDFTINDCINLSIRKVDMIRDEMLKKLQVKYPGAEIIFINEKPKDSRMLFFSRKRQPFFLKNINDLDDVEKVQNDDFLKYYKSFIQPNDPLKDKAKLSSEICVPLLYKMMMPFGYVKCTSFKDMTDDDFSVLRKFGMSASTVYTNDRQIITSSDDKIAVTDLSSSGLGVFFKNKVLIKHFKENTLVIFTIYLPDKKQATLLCEVRNISLIQNYVYRIGCEIVNIEALGEVYYEEYLESLEGK